jgi:hypothetical protein
MDFIIGYGKSQAAKHRHTAHPHHLLIQPMLCKHGCHTPAVSAAVVKLSAGIIMSIYGVQL